MEIAAKSYGAIHNSPFEPYLIPIDTETVGTTAGKFLVEISPETHSHQELDVGLSASQSVQADGELIGVNSRNGDYNFQDAVAGQMESLEHALKFDEPIDKTQDPLPLDIVETTKEEAYPAWKRLREQGKASIIVPSNEHLNRLTSDYNQWEKNPAYSIDAITNLAETNAFPWGLIRDSYDLREYYENEDRELGLTVARDSYQPMSERADPWLNWAVTPPTEKPRASENAQDEEEIDKDVQSRFKQTGKGYILIAPTDDWTLIPAFLRLGGWNQHPNPWEHVAAWRLWRNRLDVTIPWLEHDALSVIYRRYPETYEEASFLARGLYLYNPEFVEECCDHPDEMVNNVLFQKGFHYWWD